MQRDHLLFVGRDDIDADAARLPVDLHLSRFVGPLVKKGTNPEELIAAAHAGCFTMALAFGLQGAGYTPTELSTEAAVTLEQEGQGFRIIRSALTLRAQVPNLDEAAFARMAGEAEKNCPVSKVLNAEITLDAKLI
jgi:osmotically inducible protein OsmC